MEQQKIDNMSDESKETIQETKRENVFEKEGEKELMSEMRTEEMETRSGEILIDHLKIEPVVTEITTEIVPIPVDNERMVSECLDKDSEANNQPGYEISEGVVEVVCVAETNSSDVVTEVDVKEKETKNESSAVESIKEESSNVLTLTKDETQNNLINEIQIESIDEIQNVSMDEIQNVTTHEIHNDSIHEDSMPTNVLTNDETPNDSTNDETSFIVETKPVELEEPSGADDLSTDVVVVEQTDQIDGDAIIENTNEIDEDVNIVEDHTEDSHETCDPGAINIVEEIVTTSKTTTYSIEIQEQDSLDDRDCFVEKNLLMLEVVSENDSSVNVFEGSIQELEIEQTAGDYDTSGDNLSKEISFVEDNKIDSNNESFENKELDDESSQLYNTETVRVEIVENEEEEEDNETVVEDSANEEELKKNSPIKKENHRSVIQEIVDDWIDDTNDDTPDSKTSLNDYHDSVEIELKTLLADDNKLIERESKSIKINEQSGEKSCNQIKLNLKNKKTRKNTESGGKERLNGLENLSVTGKGDEATEEKLSSSVVEKPEKKPIYVVPPHVMVRSVTNPTEDVIDPKRKAQQPKAGVKIPVRHLLSQIASKAEVTEVLQEKIKEKQSETDRPQKEDILFVKKITQRLSSKLSAASVNALAAKKSFEIHSNNTTEDKIVDDAEKIETADNRELLAILEGDVDPDWSNLKPQTAVVEASKSSEVCTDNNKPVKLDPLMERELALKQLLELPTISTKKNSAKKKRTFKPAPSKASSNTEQSISNVDAVQPSVVSAVDSQSTRILSVEDNADNAISTIGVLRKLEDITTDIEGSHTEESRSGRKRKPTEKAREHEENSSKKQKVYKGKITEYKRSSKVQSTPNDPPRKPQLPEENLEEVKEEEESANPKPATSRNILSRIGTTKNRMYQSKGQKIGKKLPQNITKRNMPVKKLLRQKPSTSGANSKSVHMKSKFITSPKKYRNTIKQKVEKDFVEEVPSSDIKPKKKTNEIDKLLQDEGVVNLLYDVEQPGRKRLVPITKSQTKVMDLQKVQRELKIRTKLVRNAVLRLRTSGGSPTKMSPRSKRNAIQVGSPDNDSRENERNKSTRSSISSSGDFIFPAKIRNAADASVIVRRHSSSSFSSTSGSPRVSIDGPDRQTEPCGSEEGPAHVTRSAKRRHSQNEKNKQSADCSPAQKKIVVSRKKSMDITDNEGTAATIVVVEKSVTPVRSTSRNDSKTPEKINKNIDSTDTGKSSGIDSGTKVATRSNGVPSEKEVIKTKKGTKTKAALLNKAKEVVEPEIDNVEEDKLSACLAEAVSALSNVEGTENRSASTTANRKLKTYTNITKPLPIDQSQPDISDNFDNTEINLRRHGNIVQLILTPSSNKLKNGMTLQIMHELCDALLMLRKDETCRVVLLTSTGTSFCEGLDLSNLIHTNREERRVHAEEMATGVKEFIKTLANFNKPIVAGIQGAAVGLGVTMLPLFDLVIASDKATFSTPYGQLGQIPEGAAILTLSQTVGNTITSELLLGGRVLTASEALRAGLVTRVLWPDRFQGELIPSLRTMSEQSSQSMEATKTLLRHSLRKKLDAALESESYLLIQHWCSAECQTLIKSYLDGKDH